ATLSGQVFLDADHDLLLDNGEVGRAGVTVTLSGFDTQGNPVSLSTQTDTNGFFTFSDPSLVAGTYTISEQSQNGFASEVSIAGSDGGDASTPGTIGNITLNGGDAATGYLFGDVFSEG